MRSVRSTAATLGALAALAWSRPGLACENIFDLLPNCAVGNCWYPVANTSLVESVILPAISAANVFMAESSSTLFSGQSVKANLCVGPSDEAFSEFCEAYFGMPCEEAVENSDHVRELAKVVDYGCSVDAEGPMWFDIVDDTTVVGACNNATLIQTLESCAGTFGAVDTVLLPPYYCNAQQVPAQPHAGCRRYRNLRELHRDLAKHLGARYALIPFRARLPHAARPRASAPTQVDRSSPSPPPTSTSRTTLLRFDNQVSHLGTRFFSLAGRGRFWPAGGVSPTLAESVTVSPGEIDPPQRRPGFPPKRRGGGNEARG